MAFKWWASSTVEPKLPEQTPIIVSASLIGTEAEAYAELGKRAGFSNASAATVPNELLRLLAERGLYRYDEEKVVQYLDRKLGFKSARLWTWRALGESDARYADSAAGGEYRGYDGTRLSSKLYSKPVPAPVLETIAEIRQLQRRPEALAYVFVSDQRTARETQAAVRAEDLARAERERQRRLEERDPFAMALYKGEMVVFERWDEPSFR